MSHQGLKCVIIDMIVTAELSRQRRGMQAELSSKVNTLEEEVSRLKEELGKFLFLRPLIHTACMGYDGKVTPRCICLVQHSATRS